MRYRILGKTGIEVSEIGFGAWAIGSGWGDQPENESIAALNRAIDLGVNFIDTALAYGQGRSESIIAKVLKNRREEVTVATKIPPAPGPWPPTPYCDDQERFSEKYIRDSVEQCRNNLQTDCIDIIQLHTWTRAWNKNPRPLDVLNKLKQEGKIKYIGISTPEHDQNALIELMRKGYLDVIQLIYNIFEQEPASELFPVANEENVGVIVRVVFDEGVLTGKYKADHQFPSNDFRSRYFAGDRLKRAVERVEKIKKEIGGSGFTMAQTAIKFALAKKTVGTVITGIRNIDQAEMNVDVSELPELPDELLLKLRDHAWLRGFWYAGK